MSTADVARDLDFLRQEVGDRLLTCVGYSYGSYLDGVPRKGLGLEKGLHQDDMTLSVIAVSAGRVDRSRVRS